MLMLGFSLVRKFTKRTVELLLLIFQMCFVRMAVNGIYIIVLLSAVIPA